MSVAAVASRIAEAIRACGPIPFDSYMALALFDLEGGYYATDRARIGRHGDYYTNVSIGAVFGRVLAGQFAQMAERLGAREFQYVEQGANDGRLAADIMKAARAHYPQLFESLAITLVEPFAKLREKQAAVLAEYSPKIRWVESIELLPHFAGVHFTNEYVDAIPAKIVVWNGSQWLERCVGLDRERLVWIDLPLTNIRLVAGLPTKPPTGYTTEIRSEAGRWITSIARKVECGYILIVDYGYPRSDYYHPSRRTGTLSCYANHRRDYDPLSAPGEKDITAHVEFTSLAEAGIEAGLRIEGFADQYHFLTGAADSLLRIDSGSGALGPIERRQLRSLLHPELMGTQFKYLCFSKTVPNGPPLNGFLYARNFEDLLGPNLRS